MTLRRQNRCRDCRHCWYPRGSNLSARCPECKSPNVGFVPLFDWGGPPAEEHRPRRGGASGGGQALTITLIVLGVFVGLPLLGCLGLCAIGGLASPREKRQAAAPDVKKADQKPPVVAKKQPDEGGKVPPKVEPKLRSRAELRELLRNKTQADVEQLLGAPAARGAEEWAYEGELSYDPAADRFDKRVIVRFVRGRVGEVDFEP